MKKVQDGNRVVRQRALQILAEEDESPRSNTHSYSTHFKRKNDPEKKKNKVQPVGNRKELDPINWEKTCYHKIKTNTNLSSKSQAK